MINVASGIRVSVRTLTTDIIKGDLIIIFKELTLLARNNFGFDQGIHF